MALPSNPQPYGFELIDEELLPLREWSPGAFEPSHIDNSFPQTITRSPSSGPDEDVFQRVTFTEDSRLAVPVQDDANETSAGESRLACPELDDSNETLTDPELGDFKEAAKRAKAKPPLLNNLEGTAERSNARSLFLDDFSEAVERADARFPLLDDLEETTECSNAWFPFLDDFNEAAECADARMPLLDDFKDTAEHTNAKFPFQKASRSNADSIRTRLVRPSYPQRYQKMARFAGRPTPDRSELFIDEPFVEGDPRAISYPQMCPQIASFVHRSSSETSDRCEPATGSFPTYSDCQRPTEDTGGRIRKNPSQILWTSGRKTAGGFCSVETVPVRLTFSNAPTGRTGRSGKAPARFSLLGGPAVPSCLNRHGPWGAVELPVLTYTHGCHGVALGVCGTADFPPPPIDQQQERNDSRPRLQTQAMENASAGEADAAVRLRATHTPNLALMKQHDHVSVADASKSESMASLLETTTPVRATDHGIESNLRDTAGYDDMLPRFNIANGDGPYSADEYASHDPRPEILPPSSPSAPPASIIGHEKAYGKVQFADGYYLITTTHVMLTRDLAFQEYARLQQKQAKKDRKHGRVNNNYSHEQEASEPSQHDGGDNDDDDDDLVGRPAPATFSQYSQSGGVVGLPGGEEESSQYQRSLRRRGNHNSSSNQSIAPQSLHDIEGDEEMLDQPYTGTEYQHVDTSEWAQLPIHTPNPADIKKISKEHLLFRFNSDKHRWVVDVIGNLVVINGVVYKRGEKDISLYHGDEIFISTVLMVFLLPEDDDDDGESGVVNSVEDGYHYDAIPPTVSMQSDSEDSEDEEDEHAPTPSNSPQQVKSTIKLKLKGKQTKQESRISGNNKGAKDPKKKPVKTDKGKGKMLVDDPERRTIMRTLAEEDAPTSKTEKAKGKAPKMDAPGGHPSASAEPQGPRAPSVERQLDPNSAYANVAPDQLPEKRKGPGRPPKNGLISKRDDAAVKRKLKEYERLGIAPPAHNEILEMVRAEQRAKDALAKAQQRGEPAPDVAMPNRDASAGQSQVAPGSSQTPNLVQPQPQGEGSPDDVTTQRHMSPPLPRRTAKSPSPVPPRESFSEEQMKKPSMTYLYMIDEVLQEIGQGDLPAIYDRMMKRWPYFKYICQGTGWQSSVRHNLLASERFVDSGKSGKGKIWVVNFDVELDSKKKKVTPPPRPPTQNGQMPHGIPYPQQYGQQPYNAAYGQQPVNGQMAPNYATPYGNGYPPPQPPNLQNMHQYPQQHTQPPPYQQPPPQMPPPAPTNINQNGPSPALVFAIVQFRVSYMQPFMGTANQNAEDQRFNGIVDLCEHVQAGTRTLDDGFDQTSEPYRTVRELFRQHGNPAPTAPAQQNPQSQVNPSGPAQSAAAPVQGPAPTQVANSMPAAPQGQQRAQSQDATSGSAPPTDAAILGPAPIQAQGSIPAAQASIDPAGVSGGASGAKRSAEETEDSDAKRLKIAPDTE